MYFPRWAVIFNVSLIVFTSTLFLENCGSSGSSSSDSNTKNSNTSTSGNTTSGNTTSGNTTSGNTTSGNTTSSSNNTLFGNNTSLVGQTIPATGSASFTATTNGNFSFTVESGVFDAYSSAEDGNVGAVFAFFSSSPNLCLDFNASSNMNFTVAPSSTLTVLWMQNYNATTSLYGDSSTGNFTIGGSTGDVANVFVYHFNANCVIDTNVTASAGTISLSTLMVGSNANLAGSVSDAYLGATNGNLSGSFTASPCGNLAKFYSATSPHFVCSSH